MYKVFGYDWECQEFNYTFDSFVQAINVYRKLSGNTVFIKRDGPRTCLFVH